MASTKTFVCADCGADFETRAWNAERCKDCRRLQHNARRRMGKLKDRECEACGTVFTPTRTNGKFCSRPCASKSYNDSRGYEKTEHSPRDEQMERLFRYYKSRESIKFDGAKDGQRLISLSDTQIPFVDEPLWDATLAFVDDFKPHYIVINGDFLDCYAISDFDKRPERKFSLADEIEQASDMLDQLQRRSAGRAKIFWVDGNHEERVQRVIWRKAEGFSMLVKDLPEALELEKRAEGGFVPWGKHVDFHGFAFTHGHIARKNAAYTARAMMEGYNSSGVSGHTHRAGSHSRTDMHKRSHTWVEQGCLCRVDLEYVKGVADWQQAFLVGTMHNGALHPSLIRVIETDLGKGFDVYGNYYEVKRD